MAREDCTRILGGWEGYLVGTVSRFEAGRQGPTAQVWIELHPQPGGVMLCDGCGLPVTQVHDLTERWVRDLPLFEAAVWLLVHRRRVLCPRCGPKLERLAWLERYARVTRRLAENVARLCAVLPVKHVAELLGLDRKTVKQIDKRHLLRTLGPPDLTGLEVIAVDEFAIHKGHRYATVVVDPRCKRVLWVVAGCDRQALGAFFDRLGPEGCRKLQAVVMDMHGAYREEVHARCPQAEIVYDLFHVVAKYGREVIDRVRVDEANRLRQKPRAREVIKGARWLLLRNAANVRRKADRIRLRELLAANRALATVYILKDDLKHLWEYNYPGAAYRFWREWYDRAIRSRLRPLQEFARKLQQYLPGILAHCRWPLHTSLLEGINNKIKVLKRMAYGFHDDEYFFLKIRAAFPGNGT